ncbi:putative Transposase-associated domain-containing protein [Helianthus debilis subsp. tardiflorus]
MEWYTDRQWMYEKTDSEGFLNSEYCDNVDFFLDFAFSNDAIVDKRVNMHGDTIREIKCPCYKCKNISYRDRATIQKHLYKDGFMLRYETWSEHGGNFVVEKYKDEPPKFDQDLWKQATGGMKKGKVYGLGIVTDPYVHGKQDPEIEKLNEIIKELVKEKEEDKERFNGIIGGLVAQMEREKEEKEAMLVRMMKIEAMLTTLVRK